MSGKGQKRFERDTTIQTDLQQDKKSKLLPKTGLGVNSFRRLVEDSTVIVDKSMLIKEFFEDAGEVVLITYPRRWGKSINMDMIKSFFELEVDESGHEIPFEEKRNVKLFKEGIISETGKKSAMAIWQEEEFVSNHFGKYPVIKITFKGIKGSSYAEVQSLVFEKIYGIFEEYDYLLNNEKISFVSKIKLRKIFERTKDTGIMHFSLKFLSKLLHTYFNHQVLILLDEYDTPINNALMNFSIEEGEKVLDLFRVFLGEGLKENAALQKGFVTGILRIAKASLFSDINNLQEYSMLKQKYAAYYGFTSSEVDRLIVRYAVGEETALEIKDWYNGYKIGGQEIYNPWSVLNSLKTYGERQINPMDHSNILRSYWEESGTINFIQKLFEIQKVKQAIESLVSREKIFTVLIEQFTMDDFLALKKIISSGSNCEINDAAVDLLLSYLFMAGYFTATDEPNHFLLPNQEIRREFAKKLQKYYSMKYSVDGRLFDQATDTLQLLLDKRDSGELTEAIKKFEEVFSGLLGQLPVLTKITEQNISSSSAQIIHANEDVIHSLLNYIVLRLHTIEKFGSEVYLGSGRADIVFTDRSNSKGVIVELKYNGSASEALNQIKNQEYAKSLIGHFDTLLIGLNVDVNRDVSIEHEMFILGENDHDTIVSE